MEIDNPDSGGQEFLIVAVSREQFERMKEVLNSPEGDSRPQADTHANVAAGLDEDVKPTPNSLWGSHQIFWKATRRVLKRVGLIVLGLLEGGFSCWGVSGGGLAQIAGAAGLTHLLLLVVIGWKQGKFSSHTISLASLVEFCLAVVATSILGIVNGGSQAVAGAAGLAIMLLLVGLRLIRGPADQAEIEFRQYLRRQATWRDAGQDNPGSEIPNRLRRTLVEGEHVVAVLRRHPITIIYQADPAWRAHLRGVEVIAFFWGVFTEANERFGKGGNVFARLYHRVIAVVLFVFVGVPALFVSFVLYEAVQAIGIQNLLWVSLTILGLLLYGSVHYRIRRWETEMMAVIAQDGVVTKVIILQNLVNAKDYVVVVARLEGFEVVEHSLAAWAAKMRVTWLEVGTVSFKEGGKDRISFGGVAGARAFYASGLVGLLQRRS